MFDAEAAIEASERSAARCGPFNAEIIPDTEAKWHLLRVNAATIAAAHLVGRRFGVYDPSDYVTRQRLFPGYLFVFVWDIELHRRRIQACPGVLKIMRFAGLPVVVPDRMINRIQAMEFQSLCEVEPRKRKRYRKQNLWVQHSLESPPVITIKTRSVFDGIRELDTEARISILHRALGLPSVGFA